MGSFTRAVLFLFTFFFCASSLLAMDHGVLLPVTAGDGKKEKDEDSDGKKEIPPPPANNLAYSSASLGKDGEKLDKALTDYLSFLTVRTNKRLRAAISGFRGVGKTSLAYPIAAYYLAWLYCEDQEFDKAREILKPVVEAKPGFFEALALLGRVELEDQKPQDAVPLFEKSLGIYAHNEEAVMGLAEAQVFLGRFKDAEKSFAKAVELGGDDGYADEYLKLVREHIKGPDWQTTHTAETENYIVNTPISKAYAEHMARCLERVRKLYKEYFPTTDRVPRKSEVYIHPNDTEYFRAGGPPETYGYYSPATRSLHLYEQKEGHANTLTTLYHEGFHQYLHEIGNIPIWLNEGLAEFFAGALISSDGKQAEMGPDPGRLDNVMYCIQNKLCPTAEELMNMSHEEMYTKDPAVNYAQAWAIVYYCMEGENSAHRTTLGNYFRLLRKGLDQRDAYEQTFAKVDMKRFETNWRNFVDRLPDPKDILARQQKAAEFQK